MFQNMVMLMSKNQNTRLIQKGRATERSLPSRKITRYPCYFSGNTNTGMVFSSTILGMASFIKNQYLFFYRKCSCYKLSPPTYVYRFAIDHNVQLIVNKKTPPDPFPTLLCSLLYKNQDSNVLEKHINYPIYSDKT